MKNSPLALSAVVGLLLAGRAVVLIGQPDSAAPLPAPVFHHVHQNSTDPAAAIVGFRAIFPSLATTTVAGFEAVQSTNGALILFTKVTTPLSQPQSAFLRHVFSVPDVGELVRHLRSIVMTVRPLHTVDGLTVEVSSETYQNGMTRAVYDEAKAKGALVPPTKSGGYVIFWGPENVLIEATERNTLQRGEVSYSLVDMWHDHSICAELWYRTHLNLPACAGRGGAPAPVPTEASCRVPKSEPSFPSVERTGTIRQPGGGAPLGPVSLNWFAAQSDRPLAPTRGQLVDHIAVSVEWLDPWMAKLTAEKVTFLQPPYPFGDRRAIMIEGPSRESVEIIGR